MLESSFEKEFFFCSIYNETYKLYETSKMLLLCSCEKILHLSDEMLYNKWMQYVMILIMQNKDKKKSIISIVKKFSQTLIYYHLIQSVLNRFLELDFWNKSVEPSWDQESYASSHSKACLPNNFLFNFVYYPSIFKNLFLLISRGPRPATVALFLRLSGALLNPEW